MGTPGPHPADRLRRRYSFGEFTLDLDDGFLRRVGSSGKTGVVPLPPGRMLPELPPSGMVTLDDPTIFPGSFVIDAYEAAPSADPSIYAYVKTTMHRNLFRIPLP